MNRNFEFKLLGYDDAVETNDPQKRLIDDTTIISTDLGSGAQQYLTIPGTTTDQEVSLAAAACLVLFIKNKSTKPIKYKLNGIGSTEYIIAAGGVLYLESADVNANDLITSLHITNENIDDVNLTVFSATKA